MFSVEIKVNDLLIARISGHRDSDLPTWLIKNEVQKEGTITLHYYYEYYRPGNKDTTPLLLRGTVPHKYEDKLEVLVAKIIKDVSKRSEFLV